MRRGQVLTFAVTVAVVCIVVATAASGTDCSLEDALIVGAGPGAIQCGDGKLLTNADERFDAATCVHDALKKGEAFHLRYLYLFRDSYGEEGFFGTGNGAVTRLMYDRIFTQYSNVAYERIWRDDCPQASVVIPTAYPPKSYPPVDCADWIRIDGMCETDRFWLMVQHYRGKLYGYLQTLLEIDL